MPEMTRKLTGLDQPRLLPILPLIYVAWADGDLTATEIERIRGLAESLPWVYPIAKRTLGTWLDPERPPSPEALQGLLRRIQEVAERMDPGERRSLAKLGQDLAAADPHRAGSWVGAEVQHALAEIEEALGVVGHEATTHVLSRRRGPAVAIERAAPEPTFPVEPLRDLLAGPAAETRRAVRELVAPFGHEYDLGQDAYRARVREQLAVVARAGLGRLAYPDATGGDLGRFLAAFETLAEYDLSLTVKYGVQFGLFGGSLYFLGSDRHRAEWLDRVASLEAPGCFAMTEMGHGSNVRDLETVARWDRARGDFVLDTPRETARKEFIGGAARDARLATVFAQLEVGPDRHGVHAFLVEIRDERGQTAPGVRLEDCGAKMGLAGVDNGRLWFQGVRVPRDRLLDRYATVGEDGEYQSPIPSASKRFFTMLGTLVGGRIAVAGAALAAARVGLTIAIRYGAARRQFGAVGQLETPILDYRTHQRRLVPPLATAYALAFAHADLAERYRTRREGDDGRELEALAAGIKAYATAWSSETLLAARECCGGQGYLAENRFGRLIDDVEVTKTFEGDNTVLLQLVAKSLLTEYRQHFQDDRFFKILRHLADQAAVAITELNPLVTRSTDESHLRDREFHRAALRYREQDLLASAARRIQRRIQDGLDATAAVNECQTHLVALARAHVERLALERFAEGTLRAPAEVRPVLDLLCDVFALSRIRADRGWFLEQGYLVPAKSKAIRKLADRLAGEVREHAPGLVEAFGIPDAILGAPIALAPSSYTV